MTESTIHSDLAHIQLVVRRPNFEFKNEEIPRFYYRESPALTQIFNAFNAQIVPIETFFLKDGKEALSKNLIEDPVLKKDIEDYLKQEGMHISQHNKFNELLRARGYPIDWAQDMMWDRLEKLDGEANEMLRVATGVSCEHVLGELGELVLNDPALTQGLHPTFKALIEWHFYEEIEHKSVAIDAFHDVFGKGWRSYIARVRSVWVLFQILIPSGFRIRAAFRECDRVRMQLKDWTDLLRLLFIKPAVFFRIARAVMSLLNPAFHPWTYRNNRSDLDRHRATAIRDEWAVEPGLRRSSSAGR